MAFQKAWHFTWISTDDKEIAERSVFSLIHVGSLIHILSIESLLLVELEKTIAKEQMRRPTNVY